MADESDLIEAQLIADEWMKLGRSEREIVLTFVRELRRSLPSSETAPVQQQPPGELDLG